MPGAFLTNSTDIVECRHSAAVGCFVSVPELLRADDRRTAVGLVPAGQAFATALATTSPADTAGQLLPRWMAFLHSMDHRYARMAAEQGVPYAPLAADELLTVAGFAASTGISPQVEQAIDHKAGDPIRPGSTALRGT